MSEIGNRRFTVALMGRLLRMREQTVLRVTGHVLADVDDVLSDVWVIDGRISLRRPARSAAVETITGWALPGLVDAHCHIGLDAHGAVDDATAQAQALTDRAIGTLLIRDAGSPADTRWMDDRPDLPRIVRAGRHIARTRRYVRNFAHEIEPGQLVDHVRQEARRGDGWVKIVGDWIDRDTGDLLPCWPAEAVRAAVVAAHEEGARMTAHCFGEQVLVELAEAGIECVEHATGLQPETIGTFAAQGITIVPTLVNIATFPTIADGAQDKFPQYARHMRDLHTRRYDTVRAAHEAGIPIRLGTDAGGSLAHGLAAREALELSRAGLSNRDVLVAGSWGAREWLGHPGIREGAPADLVVYRSDPREDLRVLLEPYRILLRGNLVR